MQRRFGSGASLRVIVALGVVLTTSPASFGATITINNNVAIGPITDGSSIVVDGWVYGAQTRDPEDLERFLTPPNVNKVKIYLFYQQTRPSPGNPGSPRYQLDADLANFALGSSPDAPYNGSVTANMPSQENTPISPRCWFLHCEALLDTPQSPNTLVAVVEKDVDLVWTSGPPGGS